MGFFAGYSPVPWIAELRPTVLSKRQYLDEVQDSNKLSQNSLSLQWERHVSERQISDPDKEPISMNTS